jgi:nucleoside-diphosphate-sugar epimerase
MGAGFAGWAAVVRLLRSGAYNVVVVDSIDRLAAGEAGRMAVLALLRRSGVRLLAVRDCIDTGDAIGADLVGSLLDGGDRRALIAA